MKTTSHPKSQATRILWLLHAAWPNWVPADALARISLGYGARIHSLRRKGYEISNKTEMRNGVKHGSFRLGGKPIEKRPIPIRVERTVAADKALFDDLAPDRSYAE